MNVPQEISSLARRSARSGDFTRLIRFCLIGILNTAIGYGAFYIFSYYLQYLIALVISHIIGVTNSYVWNKYWTFKTRKNVAREFLKFNSIYLIVLIVNIVMLGTLVDGLHFNPRVGQLIVLPIVTFISYFGHRYWSFNIK
jgi:putative flippase GtrA